jgi:fucose 4-O-acetylase-like acetyltransferase
MASQTKPGPSLPLGAAATAVPIPPGAAPAGTRLWFVDHLRLMLICGVVVAHVASIYAGGWYHYHDPIQADVITTIGLGIPGIIADSFGLGFFFLIAGYFTPGSYDRKGGASFLRDRLVRLGIPLLLYDLLLDPLVVYVARGLPGSYWNFYGPYLLQMRTLGPVVAWFIAALLQFTLLYAAWRWLTRKRSHVNHRPATLPGTRAILGFIVALGLLSFVVRLWWPLGWWWSPPWWMHLLSLPGGFLPQFLSLYVLGCIAYRRNWFAELTPKMGRDWSLMALLATLVAVPFVIVGVAAGQLNYFVGGFHWQALGEAVWEAFLVVGVCLGSLVLFRQRWNRQGRLAKSLAGSSYTVYLIHPLVVVSVALAFSTVALSPLLKFGMVVLFVLPLSFLVGLVLRKLPLANRVL